MSSITFTATVLGSIIGHIPSLRIMISNWRGKDRATKSGKNGGGDVDKDDIALVDVGEGGGGRRLRSNTDDLPRAEIL